MKFVFILDIAVTEIVEINVPRGLWHRRLGGASPSLKSSAETGAKDVDVT